MAKIKMSDKVRIIKPGTFKNLEGQVVSIGKSKLSVKVDLTPYGTWSFSEDQIELINKPKK